MKTTKTDNIVFDALSLFVIEITKEVIKHLCGRTHVKIEAIEVEKEPEKTTDLGSPQNGTVVLVEVTTQVGNSCPGGDGKRVRFNIGFTVNELGVFMLTSEVTVRLNGVQVTDPLYMAQLGYNGRFEGLASTKRTYDLAQRRLSHC